MKKFREGVLVGNLAIYPDILRKFLKKSYYFLIYDADNEIAELKVNHRVGGETIFEIRNISYENAAKLALRLGLESKDDNTLIWHKWNPVCRLYDDGSQDAESLKILMFQRNIPCVIVESKELGWTAGDGVYKPVDWSVEEIREKIEELAERYQEALTTSP